MLREAHEDGGMGAALFGNRIDRLHGDDVRILRDEASDLLEAVGKVRIGLRDEVDESLVIRRLRRRLVGLLYPRHTPTPEYPLAGRKAPAPVSCAVLHKSKVCNVRSADGAGVASAYRLEEGGRSCAVAPHPNPLPASGERGLGPSTTVYAENGPAHLLLPGCGEKVAGRPDEAAPHPGQ